MLKVEFAETFKGDRDENLDRFGHISGNNWSVSYLLDGYKIATPHYVDSLQDNINNKLSAKISHHSLIETLNSAFIGINSEGKSSAVLVICINSKTLIMTAGDTRAYMLSSNIRTTDHSQVQFLVEQGKIHPSHANKHPLRKYIRKSIEKSSSLTSFHIDTYEGVEDILLCTDGFWSHLNDKYIFQLTNAEKAAIAFEKSKEKDVGHSDNQTLVLLSKITN